ncbi:hypothetical protein IW261DRAFT_454887 [Armillaria novae-zelandiae]|uniref:Nephrocystin 3-like N-terminal domain-containing protein n=1 Tax=Armillaria novae-zelandiae TaxID=153914 RepID=A0AA39UEJ3_9AGAR|nr:hypothetical protein IW261DRAFT_454887 [Armillaria novae-zelandiae]
MSEVTFLGRDYEEVGRDAVVCRSYNIPTFHGDRTFIFCVRKDHSAYQWDWISIHVSPFLLPRTTTISTAVSTKRTMANEERRMLFIRELEIVKIVPTKESRFRFEITSGDKKQKTEVIKIGGVGFLPKWTQNLTLDFDPQALVLWELHGRQRFSPRFKVLASVEKTLGELFEGNNDTSADIHLYSGSSEVAVLKVFVQLDSPSNVAIAIVPDIEEPSESSNFLDPSTQQTVFDDETAFDATKAMIDTLAGVHPAATVARGFLSIGFEVLKNQRDMQDVMRNLYKDMISVYEEFGKVKDDILSERDGLQGIYDFLFKQTIECALFIEGYGNESVIGRLVTMDISDQAEKFSHAFADLKNQLSRGHARDAAIVTLGVQKSVDLLIMRDQLRDLQPPKELRPKLRCTEGTRVATINNIVSWIAQCDSKMMWCNGLGGTGKSSLMGTLHNLLTTDFGGRCRLAAYIRYDRMEYSRASKLITSIAYSLGMFDDRIGMAISQVIKSSPMVVTMSDPSAQFRLLLRNPLEGIPDLVKEGPLVVIVDGLDECEASKELLVALAEGFGPTLPFMRLIVTSRPVLSIATAFERQDCVCPLQLDTSSKAVNDDIHFYLEREFATMHDDTFLEKCTELDAINGLTARASGLFIWAATVVKFVHASLGILRLQALLHTKPPKDATEALTTLYCTSLDTLVSEPGANAEIKKYVQSVLGAVLAVHMPPGMTEDILDKIVLLGEGSPPSHHILSMLGSLLRPETEDESIQFMHKSFEDFLQDQSQCEDDWFVDVRLHHKAIAKQCQIASKSFLKTWSPTSDMDIRDVPAYISKYALFGRFWYSDFDMTDIELFTSFFHPYFLPWLDIVVKDGDKLHFETKDTVCQQHGLTHSLFMCNIDYSELIHHVLQGSTGFHHHLHYSSEGSTALAGKVTLEWKKLKTPSSSWNPIHNDLNSKDVIFLDVDDMAKYGFKITNTTWVPLYVSIFYFNVNKLSIESLYQPQKSVEGVKNVPLPPGKSLTIGDGTDPRSEGFILGESQTLNIGYLKLFFSIEYLDLSAITQTSVWASLHQGVSPPVRVMPSGICHTMCVPIVQKRGGGAL